MTHALLFAGIDAHILYNALDSVMTFGKLFMLIFNARIMHMGFAEEMSEDNGKPYLNSLCE